MVKCWDVSLIIILSCVFADKEERGKYRVPMLNVKTRQLVLEANQSLQLICRWVTSRLTQPQNHNLCTRVDLWWEEQVITITFDICKKNANTPSNNLSVNIGMLILRYVSIFIPYYVFINGILTIYVSLPFTLSWSLAFIKVWEVSEI